jgi:hypothetical protein
MMGEDSPIDKPLNTLDCLFVARRRLSTVEVYDANKRRKHEDSVIRHQMLHSNVDSSK